MTSNECVTTEPATECCDCQDPMWFLDLEPQPGAKIQCDTCWLAEHWGHGDKFVDDLDYARYLWEHPDIIVTPRAIRAQEELLASLKKPKGVLAWLRRLIE